LQKPTHVGRSRKRISAEQQQIYYGMQCTILLSVLGSDCLSLLLAAVVTAATCRNWSC